MVEPTHFKTPVHIIEGNERLEGLKPHIRLGLTPRDAKAQIRPRSGRA